MPDVHEGPAAGQPRSILQVKDLDPTALQGVALVDLLLWGLGTGGGEDAITELVSALRREAEAMARLLEENADTLWLAGMLYLFERRLRVVAEVRRRELAGQAG